VSLTKADLIAVIGVCIFKLQKLFSLQKRYEPVVMLTSCYSEFKNKEN